MRASEVLDRAADRIDERGWTVGHTGPPSGPNCAEGAIIYESRQWLELIIRCKGFLLASIREVRPTNSVIGWNDLTPGLTQEEVVAEVRHAANLARKAGD